MHGILTVQGHVPFVPHVHVSATCCYLFSPALPLTLVLSLLRPFAIALVSFSFSTRRCMPLNLSAKDGPASSSSLVKLATSPQKENALAVKMSGAAASGDELSDAKPKTNYVLLGVYFIAWYALNVGYNIANKQVLSSLSSAGLDVTMSAQFVGGSTESSHITNP